MDDVAKNENDGWMFKVDNSSEAVDDLVHGKLFVVVLADVDIGNHKSFECGIARNHVIEA